MPVKDRSELSGRSISMGGILAILIGFGMLLLQFKFWRLFRNWTDVEHRLFFGVGVLAMLWGIRQTIIGARAGDDDKALRVSRHRRRFPRPGVACLLIMIVLFIGAAIGRSNMLILVFALMAGPFVVNGWVTFMMLKRTEVSRTVPKRAIAGEPISIEVEVQNRKRLLSSWLLTVTDSVRNETNRLQPSVLFARVPPRGKRTARYHLRLMQRGRYRFGPIQAATRFPLGLVERGLMFPITAEMLVYPRIGRLTASWKRTHLPGIELIQRQQSRPGAYDDEFHHIREYRWGDNPRAIHWRTSARQNELMVCEYHQNRDRNLLVLLDLWQPEQPRQEHLDRVELAVSLTATICAEHMRDIQDSHLDLIVSGEHVSTWKGSSGPSHLEPMLESFAEIQAGCGTDIELLLERAAAKSSTNTRTLLVTTRTRTQPEVRDLDALQTATNGWRIAGGFEWIEADPVEIAQYFHIDP